MSLISTLNTPPPNVGISYPYLGSHLHTDNQTIVIWLVLATGFGVVVNKVGAPVVPATTTATLYTPNTAVFNVGYSEPQIISRYNILPYFGSVTLSTNSNPF